MVGLCRASLGTLVSGLAWTKIDPLDSEWFLHANVGIFWFQAGAGNNFRPRLNSLFSYLFLDTPRYGATIDYLFNTRSPLFWIPSLYRYFTSFYLY